jgi:integrase-like protein
MESFFATLKGELVEQRDYLTRDEARADVFQYVEGWYNCSSQSTSLYVVEGKRFPDYAETSANLSRRYGIGGVCAAAVARRGSMAARS